jgi:hypothetical protein
VGETEHLPTVRSPRTTWVAGRFRVRQPAARSLACGLFLRGGVDERLGGYCPFLRSIIVRLKPDLLGTDDQSHESGLITEEKIAQ